MHTSGSADRATMGHVTQTPVPGPAFRDVPDGPGVVGPRRNRVTPLGDIVAAPLRGAWCGNRGNLHDRGTDVVRFHDGKLWIVCALEYRNRRLEQWAPGRNRDARLDRGNEGAGWKASRSSSNDWATSWR